MSGNFHLEIPIILDVVASYKTPLYWLFQPPLLPRARLILVIHLHAEQTPYVRKGMELAPALVCRNTLAIRIRAVGLSALQIPIATLVKRV